VESRINLIANINSFFVMVVLFEIRFHLFVMLSEAQSKGTVVNNEITSKHAKVQSGLKAVPFGLLTGDCS